MSDHEDLDYEEFGVDDEPKKDDEPVSVRHARVEFPSDEEEDEERVVRVERKTDSERRPPSFPPRPIQRKKKMPWTSQREEQEQRRRESIDIKVTYEMQEALHRELKADLKKDHFDTVIVKGADGMSGSSLEKIFGDFFPYKAEMADADTGLVHFRNNADAAKMMIGMTKRLRRVRVKQAPEEGEVREESDEEEGELKQEGGDDVAVEEEGVGSKVVKEESVEINVDDVALPEGKWRVVTKHVEKRKLMLVRFATTQEIEAARKYNHEHGLMNRKRRNYDRDGFKYAWMEDKARAGLNIFDKDGNELDWDFEHDTRFYEDSAETQEEEKRDEEVMASWPAGVKVRGRGAKHARFGIKETSMNADDEKGKKRKVGESSKMDIPISRRLASRVTGGVFADEDEDDTRRDDEEDEIDEGDADPTPQQWNKGHPLEGRVTFHR